MYLGGGTGKIVESAKIGAKIDKITEKRNFPMIFFGKTFNSSISPIYILTDYSKKMEYLENKIGQKLTSPPIPPANNPNPLVLPDTSDDDNANKNNDRSSNNDESGIDNLLQGGNLGKQGEIGADAPEEVPTEGQDQGVRQSRRKNKGTTGKYADYGLMMNTQWQARGGQHQNIIFDGLMFFSVEDLRNEKPVVEEDQEEWALGVGLAHYYSCEQESRSFGRGVKRD